MSSRLATQPPLPGQSLPRHVAVVMDGNGRWARRRGLPRVAGHRAGVKSVRALVEACAEKSIEVLTLFAFSSENWRRPKSEVKLLMDLFLTSLRQETRSLHENNIRLQVIGDLTALSGKLQKQIEQAEYMTRDNTGLVLVIAANYGGRWDIAQAVRRISEDMESGRVSPEDITPDLVESKLSLHGLPEPDLFIRTGGERRISNFLLWQLAYTELYFTDTLWPDFDRSAFEAALEDYSSRQRRFGQTGEQVEQMRGA